MGWRGSTSTSTRSGSTTGRGWRPGRWPRRFIAVIGTRPRGKRRAVGDRRFNDKVNRRGKVMREHKEDISWVLFGAFLALVAFMTTGCGTITGVREMDLWGAKFTFA